MLRSRSRLAWALSCFAAVIGLVGLTADWSTSAAEKKPPANSFGVDFTKELPRVPPKSPENAEIVEEQQSGSDLFGDDVSKPPATRSDADSSAAPAVEWP